MVVYKYKGKQKLQKRFEKTEDIEYDEIFAPMANMITMLLALALVDQCAW